MGEQGVGVGGGRGRRKRGRREEEGSRARRAQDDGAQRHLQEGILSRLEILLLWTRTLLPAPRRSYKQSDLRQLSHAFTLLILLLDNLSRTLPREISSNPFEPPPPPPLEDVICFQNLSHLPSTPMQLRPSLTTAKNLPRPPPPPPLSSSNSPTANPTLPTTTLLCPVRRSVVLRKIENETRRGRGSNRSSVPRSPVSRARRFPSRTNSWWRRTTRWMEPRRTRTRSPSCAGTFRR